MEKHKLDEVTEKIRKVLNLANGLNATQGEMEVAMMKAKEIAMRYNIDLATIELSSDNSKKGMDLKIEKHTLKIRSKHPQKYHRWIYLVLMQVFGIRVITSYDGTVYFIGETVDVVICTQLFPWLEQVFYGTYTKAKKAGIAVPCAADKNGVYSGLYYGITEANKRAEAKLEKQEASSLALVVRKKDDLIKAKVAEDFPFLHTPRSSSLNSNSAAQSFGYNEGKKIKLNQMGSGAQKQQIGG